MRTTVALDADTAAAIDRLRRDRNLGISEAVNELIRAGLRVAGTPEEPFRQETASLGLRMDIANVADALAILDEFGDGNE